MNSDNKKSISKKIADMYLDSNIHKVLEMLEVDDKKNFEEKKQEVMEYLKMQEDTLLAERVQKATISDAAGRGCKEKFWQEGNTLFKDEQIVLRNVCEVDRKMFIELERETSIRKSLLEEETYRNMLWQEHIQDKALMVTIEANGEYAGYCGVNDLSCEQWEIAIELRKKWRNKGIGYIAMSNFLSVIKSRLQINNFRVKIDPNNYVSQRLFEKLGAVPYDIAEFLLHKEDDILRCEEENLEAIDDNLIKIAEKFNVEPRKLLSHVLEYKLEW